MGLGRASGRTPRRPSGQLGCLYFGNNLVRIRQIMSNNVGCNLECNPSRYLDPMFTKRLKIKFTRYRIENGVRIRRWPVQPKSGSDEWITLGAGRFDSYP